MSVTLIINARELPSVPAGSRWVSGYGPCTVFRHATYEDGFQFWLSVLTDVDNEITYEFARCAVHEMVDAMKKQFIASNGLSPNMPVDNRRILDWTAPYKTALDSTRKTWDYWKPKSPYKLKAQP